VEGLGLSGRDLRFVITGAMGGGKTSLIAHLVADGFGGVAEPARAVLAEQRAAGGDGTPERDPERFIELMLERCERDAVAHGSATAPVFFDRGVPDLIGYAELFELDTAPLEAAAQRHPYNPTVFVLPSWPEIYVTDDERRMTVEQAAAFGDRVRDIYTSLGYTLVEVPRATVVERAAFVRAAIDGT
jgi:predicted ATPase